MIEVDELQPLQPLRLPDAPALPATAVDRLPRGELGVPDLDEDPYWRLVAAFLVECRRAQTRRAYFTDLKAWYAWCAGRELHPLDARRHDVALWARQLAEQPQPSTGKVAAPASIARRLSCLSSFYGYGVEVSVLEENPARKRQAPPRRHRLDDRRTPTRGTREAPRRRRRRRTTISRAHHAAGLQRAARRRGAVARR